MNKLDWIVFNAALFGVMFAGVEIGLAIAIGTSLVLAILKIAFPRTSLLGHLPGTNVYRCCPLLYSCLPLGFMFQQHSSMHSFISSMGW